ncbi:MAG: hypothetical protein VX871_08965, partial [Pseudomonadota bacterium]|nr:hypothetical protein [Pseudomonadota bacterium]
MYRSKDSDSLNSKSTAETRVNGDTSLPASGGDIAAAAPAMQLAQAAVDLTNVKQTFTSTEGARIVLPSDATFDQIVIQDGNVYLIQPGGLVIVILNAVQFPPTLVVGDITIPSANLAQVILQAPQGVPTAGPEAGTTQSSGLNGEGPIGETGPLTPIGPLLPPTGLFFTLFDVEDFDALLTLEEALQQLPFLNFVGETGLVEEDDLSRDPGQIFESFESIQSFGGRGYYYSAYGRPDGNNADSDPTNTNPPVNFQV